MPLLLLTLYAIRKTLFRCRGGFHRNRPPYTNITFFTQIIYPATSAIAISPSGEIKTRISLNWFPTLAIMRALILRYSWGVRVLVPLDDFKSIERQYLFLY